MTEPGKRRVQVLERDQVPPEEPTAGDPAQLDRETKRRYLSADIRARARDAYEQTTEALQEYLTGIQLALSNQANAQLAVAAIAASRAAK